MSALMESALMEWLVHAYFPLAARHLLVEGIAHDARGHDAHARDSAMFRVA